MEVQDNINKHQTPLPQNTTSYETDHGEEGHAKQETNKNSPSLGASLFDEFISKGDKNLQVDTSSSNFLDSVISKDTKHVHHTEIDSDAGEKKSVSPANRNGMSPLLSNKLDQSKQQIRVNHSHNVSGSSLGSNSSTTHRTTSQGQQHQLLTPVRISDDDHPLKEKDLQSANLNSIPHRASRSGTINKRKSLIKPVAVIESNDDNISFSNTDSRISNKNSNNPNLSHTVPIGTINSTLTGNLTYDDSLMMHTRTHSRDTSINSAAGEINPLDISVLLQNLASKEIELMESKHRIEDLKKQIHMENQLYLKKSNELNELKLKVSKHINSPIQNLNSTFSNFSLTPTPTQLQPQISHTHPSIPESDESQNSNKKPLSFIEDSNNTNGINFNINGSTENKRVSVGRFISSGGNNNIDMNHNSSNTNSIAPINVDHLSLHAQETPSKIKSTADFHNIPTPPSLQTEQKFSGNNVKPTASNNTEKTSMWSKPFSMFYQFDQRMQKELQKSLDWDDTSTSNSPVPSRGASATPIANINETLNPIPNTSTNNENNPIKTMDSIPPSRFANDLKMTVSNDPSFDQYFDNVQNENNLNISKQRDESKSNTVTGSIWRIVSGVKSGLSKPNSNDTTGLISQSEDSSDHNILNELKPIDHLSLIVHNSDLKFPTKSTDEKLQPANEELHTSNETEGNDLHKHIVKNSELEGQELMRRRKKKVIEMVDF
ncbi:hypothetical protein TBLA_0B05740 [Henningerozyma blattae CBS 6284]|uniref:Topoisomerase I damage affected protein 11 n=1 Tax=Henningerozyma blattae (strain ATCC 34711 / CBS 6284 / DSM 70876 / NBRC 10599 / NRRL Y-10934 / UCD 77-7) TaxID=1071380 RepID=I2GZ49_HENB6|nr:hypothetical protein TBLA_0B05740 [Tetrapisispora blattae CBS 6284]CCH59401.1 hypothetical protein TBLA_0B05740 [Tetrapisispora blattae CBS 6284]